MTQGQKILRLIEQRLEGEPPGKVAWELALLCVEIEDIIANDERMVMQGRTVTDLDCPACGDPLTEMVDVHGVSLYCQSDRCKSRAADYGATAETRAVAYEKLKRLLEQEQEEGDQPTRQS